MSSSCVFDLKTCKCTMGVEIPFQQIQTSKLCKQNKHSGTYDNILSPKDLWNLCETITNYLNLQKKDEIDKIIKEYEIKEEDIKQRKQTKLYQKIIDVVAIDVCSIYAERKNTMQCRQCTFRMCKQCTTLISNQIKKCTQYKIDLKVKPFQIKTDNNITIIKHIVHNYILNYMKQYYTFYEKSPKRKAKHIISKQLKKKLELELGNTAVLKLYNTETKGITNELVFITNLYKKISKGLHVKEVVDQWSRVWFHHFIKGEHIFYQNDKDYKIWKRIKGIFIPLD